MRLSQDWSNYLKNIENWDYPTTIGIVSKHRGLHFNNAQKEMEPAIDNAWVSILEMEDQRTLIISFVKMVSFV